MNAPQFSRGQTLAASDLNALAQSVRDLSSRVGRAGLASRYAGPSPLRPLVESTGQPVYLAPADIGGSGGVYLRQPWVEDSLRRQLSANISPESITRDDGSPLAEGDEIFQKITVDEWGNPQTSALAVIPAGDPVPTSDTWNPSSGTTSVLFRRIGSVISDPRVANSSVLGEPTPFRPFVVLHSDGSVPILPLNAASVDSGSVQLVAPLNGSTLPIKTLVAGANVSLTDHGSSVTVASLGAEGEVVSVTDIVYSRNTTKPYFANGVITHPLASFDNGIATSGVISGLVEEDSSVSFPRFSRGTLYLPPNFGGGSELSSVVYSANTSSPYIQSGVIYHPYASQGCPGVVTGTVAKDANATDPYFSRGTLYLPPIGSAVTQINYSANTSAPTVANGVITHPLAGNGVSGVISGLVEEDSSVTFPYFSRGTLYLPPSSSSSSVEGIKGFILADGSSAVLQNIFTDGAQVSPLASFDIYFDNYTQTVTLCAHFQNGFLKFSFLQG